MTYTPKSKRDIIELGETAEKLKIEKGLWIVVHGFPPAGEKLEVLYFAYKENLALNYLADLKKEGRSGYAYQLKYSLPGPVS